MNLWQQLLRAMGLRGQASDRLASETRGRSVRQAEAERRVRLGVDDTTRFDADDAVGRTLSKAERVASS